MYVFKIGVTYPLLFVPYLKTADGCS